MKKMVLGFLSVFLVAGFVVGSIFAKPLPTSAKLEDELKGTINGFIGAIAESQAHVKAGDEASYDQCVTQQGDALKALNKTWNDLVTIYNYYVVVEGSEEAASNFEKWKEDFNNTYPEIIQDIDKCYANKSEGTISATNGNTL